MTIISEKQTVVQKSLIETNRIFYNNNRVNSPDASGSCQKSLLLWEAEFRRIEVQSQPKQIVLGPIKSRAK
jgi:hypothetical protein